ncbi:MAG: sulfotransferase [Woeseiaceae bacterium]|nr:sulfotransferase [Woeseiaceae bacterium]
MTSPAVSPVFMFGFDRSGTTLLSMMVGSHPKIAVPLSTTGLWYDLADELSSNLTTDQEIERAVDRLLAHERIRLWDHDLDRSRLMPSIAAGDYGSVVTAFHDEYARQSGKPAWASMDIATLDNMHSMNRWLPGSKFLHLVRDGRDVALSHQTYRYGLGNIAECAQKWDARVTRNLRMGAMLDDDRYMVIRYEDLILGPEDVLHRICNLVSVDYSPQMLDYGTAVNSKVPDDKKFLWPSLAEPPDHSKVERWRAEMTQSQRLVFEQRARSLLTELGYETYESLPKSTGAAALNIWYCLDQGHRMKRLRKRLAGLWPFAERRQR